MKTIVFGIRRHVTTVMVGIFLVSGLALAQRQQNLDKSADIVFINGQIYTATHKNHFAEAVAVKDGQFMEVGSTRNIDKLVGAGPAWLILAELLRCRVSLMVTSTRRSHIFMKRVALCCFPRVSIRNK